MVLLQEIDGRSGVEGADRQRHLDERR